MNEIIAAILSRRSIRKFAPEQIPAGARDLIIQAGLHAPSSKNTQAWHVLVVQNADVIDRLTAEVKSALIRANVEKYLALANNPKYRVNFSAAPTFAIVSANPAETPCPVEDCSCLMENMFLAAHALGIGSCWVNQLACITGEPRFRAVLTDIGVPAANNVYGAAAFGYAAGEPPAKLPRKPGTWTVIS